MKISLVIPVYNEEANLEWHHEIIKKFLAGKKYRHEILYVNDGSSDGSLTVIKKIAKSDSSTRYINFSRNFGKEAATSAGLNKSTGDAVVLLDADGQHPIELLDTFMEKWEEGSQVVAGVRQNDKGEGLIKRLGSWLFYKILGLIGDSSTPGLTDFGLIDRKVVDEYNKLTEHNRVTRDLISWLGFKRSLVPFTANTRHAGVASYSFSKLFKLAVDGIIKHSTRPLQLIGAAGVIISVVSSLLLIFIVVEQYLLQDPLAFAFTGTAVLAVFLSFLVGVVLTCQGLLALYIETVFHETQNRPLYVIAEEG